MIIQWKKKGWIVPALILLPFFALAQPGGTYTYSFLKLPSSARVSAVGGALIAVQDEDLNLAYQNPSLLNKSMHNQLAFNWTKYYADVRYGYTSYARHFEKYGTCQAGIHFIDYGTFQAADETGSLTGTFSASEYACVLGWAKPLDSAFAIGANVKYIGSVLEQYNSSALAVDIGLTYYYKKREFTTAFVVKNYGRQIKHYRENNKEPLPYDVQLGLSKRLAHTPIRFLLTATHLETWDLTYLNTNKPPEIDPVTGDEVIKKVRFSDKLMRHIVLGSELLFSKNFVVRVGYNYRQRKEMILDTKTSTVGISWGVGMRIAMFQFAYSRAAYHFAGGTNNFSLSVNLSKLWRK